MAYIMITTRCNMACEHCCMDAKPEGIPEWGIDMPQRVFKKALKLFEGDHISIGGGEPTLHPMFWEFIGLSFRYTESIWLATNGSITEDALVLANLAQRGVLGVSLSLDDFHDSIDERVKKAFEIPKNSYAYRECNNDSREIRKVVRILPAGRAKKTGVYTEEEGCACEDTFVTPNGDIWVCGCREESLGNVFHPNLDRMVERRENEEESCSKQERIKT